jgi:POT family proton-dependent oligopeptide transporter
MPIGDAGEVVSITVPRVYGYSSPISQQAVGLDPSLIDASGDPTRKHPELHTTSAPAFMHSEGKATLQDSYIDGDDFPTEDELVTLKRVPAKIPFKIFSVCIRLPRTGHVNDRR